MQEIENKAHELAEAILNSKEYKEYRSFADNVKRDEFLAVRVNDYRRRFFEIQTSGNTDNIKQRYEDLSNEFRDIFDSEDAKGYLDAELSVCRMLQKVDEVIYADVDIDLDFL